jgi:hypothetical protein
VGGGVAESVGSEPGDANPFGAAAQGAVEGVDGEPAATFTEPEFLAISMGLASANGEGGADRRCWAGRWG